MAYRRILARPHVLALCSASVLARLPVGMGAVALVIFVHDHTGSFGAAGLAAGAYTVGLGATSPLLGRLVDRRGPRPVVIPFALLAALALVAVVVLAEAEAGTAAIVLAAAVAGCSTPPIGGLLRQLWPRLVEPDDLVNGYVVDSLLIEVFFVTGPLLTGLLAATVGSAARCSPPRAAGPPAPSGSRRSRSSATSNRPRPSTTLAPARSSTAPRPTASARRSRAR